MQNSNNWFSFEFENKTYFVSFSWDGFECRRVHSFGNTVYISKRDVTDRKIKSLAQKLCERMRKNNIPDGTHFCLKEYEENGRVRCGIAEYSGHCDLEKDGALSNTFTNTVLKWYLGLLLCVVVSLLSVVFMSRAIAFSTLNLMSDGMMGKVISFVITLTYALYLMLSKKTWQMMLIISCVPMCFATAVASAVLDERAKLVCMIIASVFAVITAAGTVCGKLGLVSRKRNYMTNFLMCILLCAASSELVLMSSDFLSEPASVSDVAVIEESYETALDSISGTIWSELDENEKLEVLQAICDYECEVNLGFDSPTVETENLPEHTNAVFVQADKRIKVSSTYINNADSVQAVTTLLHEIRHAYQNELIKMYYRLRGTLTPSVKRLRPFRLAKEFSENAEHYVNASESIEGYYYQSVERDSREWAELRIFSYMPYIESEEA